MRRCAVHPHACGECVPAAGVKVTSSGSPPRLWGMRVALRILYQPLRFTPTPVGNAPFHASGSLSTSVHPHACGECGESHDSDSVTGGSPPRLWGMLPAPRAAHISIRFTPTPVGNATWSPSHPPNPSVHPHACGECALHFFAGLLHRGSPPRLWGMLHPKRREARCDRFTPTPVGNAAPGRLPGRCRSVHPHACGECLTIC